MPLFTDADRVFVEAIAQVDYCNPFTPARIELERQSLGADFLEVDSAWNMRADSEGHSTNSDRMQARARQVADAARQRIAAGELASAKELSLYEDVVVFILYHRYYDLFHQFIADSYANLAANPKTGFYQRFLADASHYIRVPGVKLPGGEPPEVIFALLFQIRRAFFHIFNQIVGSSRAISRLRAAVWQSIFTHNVRRYRRSIYASMGDITTLVTGPSGTGKELVARAISLARFIPFDPRTETFEEGFASSFHPLNLSALSPTLIESELFGHCRGSFTGAIGDRVGWLESCGRYGTVFLDEIGELDGQIQVKLLRVLQSRSFQRLGEQKGRTFRGKVIAATNRDLAAEIEAGRFREDLFYRLCSDMITTPSLHEQLAEDPDELLHLIRFIARQLVPGEADVLAKEVLVWIHSHLGETYAWPGNFRELEQCLRNVLVRGEYRPAIRSARGVREELAQDFIQGTISADELLKRYCTLVYAQTQSYVATADRLGIDRRTAKAKVDEELLKRL